MLVPQATQARRVRLTIQVCIADACPQPVELLSKLECSIWSHVAVPTNEQRLARHAGRIEYWYEHRLISSATREEIYRECDLEEVRAHLQEYLQPSGEQGRSFERIPGTNTAALAC